MSAIIIKKSISHFRITKYNSSKLTAILINNTKKKKFIIASMYCPRREDPIGEEFKELTENEFKTITDNKPEQMDKWD